MQSIRSSLGQLSVTEALGKAFHRFWTLLGAGILVVLIVALGFIALVVPGIILLTWYAYTVPAIMLEGKGATEGMAASKAFGRDKKGSTFLIFLTAGAVGILFLTGPLTDAREDLGVFRYDASFSDSGIGAAVVRRSTIETLLRPTGHSLRDRSRLPRTRAPCRLG